MWDLWNMAFHRSLVFQVMPIFKSRLSNKDLFSEEDLNKALKGVLTNFIYLFYLFIYLFQTQKRPDMHTYTKKNELSFKKTLKVYGIPIGTLHRYKKKMHPGNTEVKKMSMTTTQVRKFFLG